MDTTCDLSETVYYEDEGILCGQTDAGKKTDDIHDCAVIALAVATDLPYDLCREILEVHGLEKGKGVYWPPFMYDGPFKWRATIRKPVTIRRFALTHPKGSYVAMLRPRSKRCHVIAVVDGVVYNAGVDSAVARIHFAWKYEGIKKHVCESILKSSGEQ